ncbi:MAG: isocitrate/isopropylmalate dehydrogenase family protein [Bryobacteraceae bacterium]|nr:isocitrate/isopropylmalate dehydrogenase family protein [Bryobacteraceae bacterium]
MKHPVALAAGDGIGPELVEACQEVFQAVGAPVEWVETPVGRSAVARFGEELPWSSLETMKELGVVLKGPLIAERLSGGAIVRAPNGTRVHPSINNGLRRELDLYCNLRPVRGFAPVSGWYSSMDLVIVREVTEDIYSGIERSIGEDCAEAVKRITRQASRRIAQFAFEYAVRYGRRRVTAVHKANVLHKTDGLFLQCVREVAASYPGIASDDRMVDAASYYMVKDPAAFDVLVMPNQYGDILSDLAAGLAGSLGLAPGANFGEKTAMFEAAHGAAPDIAGKGIANPISLILSGALLLDHLGEREAADRIRLAVELVLAEARVLTPDLGGSATTRQLTQAICLACEKVAA